VTEPQQPDLVDVLMDPELLSNRPAEASRLLAKFRPDPTSPPPSRRARSARTRLANAAQQNDPSELATALRDLEQAIRDDQRARQYERVRDVPSKLLESLGAKPPSPEDRTAKSMDALLAAFKAQMVRQEERDRETDRRERRWQYWFAALGLLAIFGFDNLSQWAGALF
jgi:hypothetical protein